MNFLPKIPFSVVKTLYNKCNLNKVKFLHVARNHIQREKLGDSKLGACHSDVILAALNKNLRIFPFLFPHHLAESKIPPLESCTFTFCFLFVCFGFEFLFSFVLFCFAFGLYALLSKWKYF